MADMSVRATRPIGAQLISSRVAFSGKFTATKVAATSNIRNTQLRLAVGLIKSNLLTMGRTLFSSNLPEKLVGRVKNCDTYLLSRDAMGQKVVYMLLGINFSTKQQLLYQGAIDGLRSLPISADYGIVPFEWAKHSLTKPLEGKYDLLILVTPRI